MDSYEITRRYAVGEKVLILNDKFYEKNFIDQARIMRFYKAPYKIITKAEAGQVATISAGGETLLLLDDEYVKKQSRLDRILFD